MYASSVVSRDYDIDFTEVCQLSAYRVVQKTDTQFYFWDKFCNSAPILTILPLLQAKIHLA